MNNPWYKKLSSYQCLRFPVDTIIENVDLKGNSKRLVK